MRSTLKCIKQFIITDDWPLITLYETTKNRLWLTTQLIYCDVNEFEYNEMYMKLSYKYEYQIVMMFRIHIWIRVCPIWKFYIQYVQHNVNSNHLIKSRVCTFELMMNDYQYWRFSFFDLETSFSDFSLSIKCML